MTYRTIHYTGPPLSEVEAKHSYFRRLSAKPVDTSLAHDVDVAKNEVPNLYDLHHKVRWDLIVVITMMKGPYDMSTKVIPNPMVDHADWMTEMSVCPNSVNLRDYRDNGGRQARNWLMEGSRRITDGMKAGALKGELETINGEKVNGFTMNDLAKKWWSNGKIAGRPNKEILEGWEAMQSMADEVKGDTASSG